MNRGNRIPRHCHGFSAARHSIRFARFVSITRSYSQRSNFPGWQCRPWTRIVVRNLLERKECIPLPADCPQFLDQINGRPHPLFRNGAVVNFHCIESGADKPHQQEGIGKSRSKVSGNGQILIIREDAGGVKITCCQLSWRYYRAAPFAGVRNFWAALRLPRF